MGVSWHAAIALLAVGAAVWLQSRPPEPPVSASLADSCYCSPGAEVWTAVVLGATGQTGRHLVKLLSAEQSVQKVTAVVRKELPEAEMADKFHLTDEEKKKFEQKVVDFDKLDDYKDTFKGYTKAFCALGTTRAKAGSAEAFRKVDYDQSLHAARLLKEGGTQHFSLLTSAGADKNSWFLYPKTKGEIEEACSKLGFARYSIFRPGLLLTATREDRRTFEKVLQAIYPNWMLWENAKATPVEQVAKAMVANSCRAPAGPQTEEYNTEAIRLLKVGAGAAQGRKC